MGVSLKTENEERSEETMQIRGSKADVVGPPQPLPKAEHGAVASSFFSFERDPHDLNPRDSISKS